MRKSPRLIGPVAVMLLCGIAPLTESPSRSVAAALAGPRDHDVAVRRREAHGGAASTDPAPYHLRARLPNHLDRVSDADAPVRRLGFQLRLELRGQHGRHVPVRRGKLDARARIELLDLDLDRT